VGLNYLSPAKGLIGLGYLGIGGRGKWDRQNFDQLFGCWWGFHKITNPYRRGRGLGAKKSLPVLPGKTNPEAPAI